MNRLTDEELLECVVGFCDISATRDDRLDMLKEIVAKTASIVRAAVLKEVGRKLERIWIESEYGARVPNILEAIEALKGEMKK